MYTSVTQKEVQERIVKSFSCATASIRIVISTIAFGMGIDCAAVTQVIHWRPSADMESYMQECGRAGRNGQSSSAIIYVNKSDLRNKTTSEEMKKYCVEQQMCRRSILYSYFDCSTTQVIVLVVHVVTFVQRTVSALIVNAQAFLSNNLNIIHGSLCNSA